MRTLLLALTLLLAAPMAHAQAARGWAVFEVNEPALLASRIQHEAVTSLNILSWTLREQPVVRHAVNADSFTIWMPSSEAAQAAAQALRSISEPARGEGSYEFRAIEDRVEVSVTAAGAARFRREDRTQAFAILRLRAERRGFIAEQRRNGIIVVRGDADPHTIVTSMGPRGGLGFHVVRDDIDPDADLPAGVVFLPYFGDRQGGESIDETPWLDGRHIYSAATGVDEMTDQQKIDIALDAAGTATFCEFTRANVGSRVAIALNGHVLTAPRINEPICGGALQITGSDTAEENEALLTELRRDVLMPAVTLRDQGEGPPPR